MTPGKEQVILIKKRVGFLACLPLACSFLQSTAFLGCLDNPRRAEGNAIERRNKVRKFLCLVSMIFLLVAVGQAQDSTPVAVALSANLVGGAVLEITPATATWSSIMPTPVETLVPSDESPVGFSASWRFAETHKGMIVAESTSDLVGASQTLPIEQYVKHTFAGDFSYDGYLPAVSAGQQTVLTTALRQASMVADLTFSFKCNQDEIMPGVYAGTVIYTVLDAL